ncbi:MAG: tRNA (guanosine(37)-N1)-methyltransferase TrmD [Clostridia bacterium]|nr:tRNA (guanosine(37)-N1)-methyltransferase TrmD [Clostridia bacterium]
MVDAVLNESIVGRARKAGILDVRCHNIRDYSKDRLRRVDDTPYGGGKGMLMQPDPVYDCFAAVTADAPEKPRTIYLSPKGRVFDQAKAKELAALPRMVLLCGHYEGIDQRVLDEIVDVEISIGDFVLTGGELPAAVLVDAVSRLVDGVLADPECYEKESHSDLLLEYPQYTRPAVFHGVPVPAVLTGGNHALIDAWRLERSLELTRAVRPELYERYMALHPPAEKKKKRKKRASPPEGVAAPEEKETDRKEI